MSDFLVAIGLVFVIEGFLYAAFPEPMKKMLESARHMQPSVMRVAGIAALVFGVAIVWMVRN